MEGRRWRTPVGQTLFPYFLMEAGCGEIERNNRTSPDCRCRCRRHPLPAGTCCPGRGTHHTPPTATSSRYRHSPDHVTRGDPSVYQLHPSAHRCGHRGRGRPRVTAPAPTYRLFPCVLQSDSKGSVVRCRWEVDPALFVHSPSRERLLGYCSITLETEWPPPPAHKAHPSPRLVAVHRPPRASLCRSASRRG